MPGVTRGIRPYAPCHYTPINSDLATLHPARPPSPGSVPVHAYTQDTSEPFEPNRLSEVDVG
eukprot:COSAG03_NODE_384_length_8325_cov_50.332726_6_plen_62_part_00